MWRNASSVTSALVDASCLGGGAYQAADCRVERPPEEAAAADDADKKDAAAAPRGRTASAPPPPPAIRQQPLCRRSTHWPRRRARRTVLLG